MNNYIVDTHCHLDLIEKQGAKIEEIIENSLQNNVKLLQTICTRITEIEKILSYTKLYDFIYTSAGVHPCNVLEQPKYYDELFQAKIIEAYLPKMMDEEEVKAEVAAAIEAVGASGPQDMGKVMGLLSGKLAGKADGKLIASLVKELLAK